MKELCHKLCPHKFFPNENNNDRFLSLRVFGLLSLSLLLFPQVLDDMSSGLCQVFIELGNLRGTLNYIFYCSDSISHNRVQVLSIPVLLLVSSQDWTCNLQMIVSLETLGTNAYNRYAMCPAGQFWIVQQDTYRPKCCRNNNKDEDNSPKTLNDKNNQASSQKFRQLIMTET